MELEEKLREVVSMAVALEPEQIGSETSFAGLEVDSLSRLEIISTVEQHLGVVIPEDRIPVLDSINEVLRFATSLTPA